MKKKVKRIRRKAFHRPAPPTLLEILDGVDHDLRIAEIEPARRSLARAIGRIEERSRIEKQIMDAAPSALKFIQSYLPSPPISELDLERIEPLQANVAAGIPQCEWALSNTADHPDAKSFCAYVRGHGGPHCPYPDAPWAPGSQKGWVHQPGVFDDTDCRDGGTVGG